MMTNGDREGLIFLSRPHMNNRFVFLLASKDLILYWKNMKKTSRIGKNNGNPDLVCEKASTRTKMFLSESNVSQT